MSQFDPLKFWRKRMKKLEKHSLFWPLMSFFLGIILGFTLERYF